MFALFIALSGVGVAAYTLPSHSVGTTQIKNDSVTAAKIAHNSISSVLIKNGSLTAADFAAGQLPAGPKGEKGDTGAAGPQGPKGETGVQGPQGPAGVMGTMGLAQESVVVPAGQWRSVTVTVPDGKQATGATAGWLHPWEEGLGFISIRPTITPAGHVSAYTATAHNDQAGSPELFTLYVPYG